MNGQWTGRFEGSHPGEMVLDVDEVDEHFEGVAYLRYDDASRPINVAFIATADRATSFSVRAGVTAVDPRTGKLPPYNELAQIFPGFTFPTNTEVSGAWDDRIMRLNWTTDVGTHGSATLARSAAATESSLQPTIQTWAQFRDNVLKLHPRSYIYRGQSSSWRLRSAFHRTGRANLLRYLGQDIPALHRSLTARMRHVFNLNDADQNGAFLHLVQHHGYPTPLIDWTYSPFVAAFFAYHKLANSAADVAPESDKVRILAFNQAQWRADFPQFSTLVCPAPHFSILEFVAIGNERMIPQQALSGLTNVDDVESHIQSREVNGKNTYGR